MAITNSDPIMRLFEFSISGSIVAMVFAMTVMVYTDIFYGLIKKSSIFILLVTASIYIVYHIGKFDHLYFHVAGISISEILAMVAMARKSKMVSIVCATAILLSITPCRLWGVMGAIAGLSLIFTFGLTMGLSFIMRRPHSYPSSRRRMRLSRLIRVMRWKIWSNTRNRAQASGWNIKLPIVSCLINGALASIFVENSLIFFSGELAVAMGAVAVLAI
jgi:hypothetical protein